MSDLSKSWMVTFFYEQELRSYYMNGVLNGILSPGIHNANLSIYTVDNKDPGPGQQSSGIYLHIKKGSTFIFSNNYKLSDNGKIIRDNNSIGTFLIKCIALEDITYDLYRWESRFPWGDNEKNMLGAERDAIYYVVASLRYNPNQGTGKSDEESGAPKYLSPTFSIVKNNDLYNNEITIGDKDSLYFKCPGVSSGRIEEELTEGVGIPDGSKNYFGNKDTILKHIAWLMLGSIIENPISRENNIGYINIENWTTNGSELWTKNHIFTGRGLPEYRKSIENNNGLNPDFIISPYLNKLFMDLGTIYDDNILFYQKNDWNNINSIGSSLTNHPSIKKPDAKKVWPLDTAVTPDHNFSISEEEWASIIQTVNKNPIYKKSIDNLHDELTFLVVDAVFLNSKKHSSNMNINIEDILTTAATSLVSEKNKLPIKSVRWVCNPGNYNFSPAYDSEDQINAIEITHKDYSYDAGKLKDKIIMPLDVCSANINRLRNIIANKNFMVALIDTLRRENLIDTTSGDSLIPVCLAFRKFKATVEKEQPLTTNTLCESTDGISTRNYIHPANILSFFDIQNNSTKANSINFKASNVYTVLPVID